MRSHPDLAAVCAILWAIKITRECPLALDRNNAKAHSESEDRQVRDKQMGCDSALTCISINHVERDIRKTTLQLPFDSMKVGNSSIVHELFKKSNLTR